MAITQYPMTELEREMIKQRCKEMKMTDDIKEQARYQYMLEMALLPPRIVDAPPLRGDERDESERKRVGAEPRKGDWTE